MPPKRAFQQLTAQSNKVSDDSDSMAISKKAKLESPPAPLSTTTTTSRRDDKQNVKILWSQLVEKQGQHFVAIQVFKTYSRFYQRKSYIQDTKTWDKDVSVTCSSIFGLFNKQTTYLTIKHLERDLWKDGKGVLPAPLIPNDYPDLRCWNCYQSNMSHVCELECASCKALALCKDCSRQIVGGDVVCWPPCSDYYKNLARDPLEYYDNLNLCGEPLPGFVKDPSIVGEYDISQSIYTAVFNKFLNGMCQGSNPFLLVALFNAIRDLEDDQVAHYDTMDTIETDIFDECKDSKKLFCALLEKVSIPFPPWEQAKPLEKDDDEEEDEMCTHPDADEDDDCCECRDPVTLCHRCERLILAEDFIQHYCLKKNNKKEEDDEDEKCTHPKVDKDEDCLDCGETVTFCLLCEKLILSEDMPLHDCLKK